MGQIRRESGTVCIMVIAGSCLGGLLLLALPQDGGSELLGGSEHALAAAELRSISDESSDIVKGALRGQEPARRRAALAIKNAQLASRISALQRQLNGLGTSPLQSLGGFTPEKEKEKEHDRTEGTAVTASAPTPTERAAYANQMGSDYRGLMGDTGPPAQCGAGPLWYQPCNPNATVNEVDHEFYGNRRVDGWAFSGPTAHPWTLSPVRRPLGYNRIAPLGTGSYYHKMNPYHSQFGPNSTQGVFHAPVFDNTYVYSLPGTRQWRRSQEAARAGLAGLLEKRWQGDKGSRWKSLSDATTRKDAGPRSAWPHRENWHWNHWDEIADPQRAHEDMVGDLDPESEAALQLMYGRMFPQWASAQKYGGVNGDRFFPYEKYKDQLNTPHSSQKDAYGFKYLKDKYYSKAYKDLVSGTALQTMDNRGWGVVDKRVPVKQAVDKIAPAWLRKMRGNTGEPIGDALHSFWQGGGLVDAAAGGGGRNDVQSFLKGKTADAALDVDARAGWLPLAGEKAKEGNLMPLRGRRDGAGGEASYDQNQFDPGESVAKAPAQLLHVRRKSRARRLQDGSHVGAARDKLVAESRDVADQVQLRR